MEDSLGQGIQRRPYGVAAKRDLRDKGLDTDDIDAALDLVHVTSVGWGQRIVEAGKIETRRCRVFRRDLLYAFVARPAYRSRNGGEKSDQINRFPFVFVISPNKLAPPFHIYPFDTGAATEGRFGDRADPFVYLEDYELAPDLSAIRKFILWAFGSNRAYFEGHLRADLGESMPAWQAAAKGYVAIANLASTGNNRPDKRASSIEVALPDHVPLRDHIKLVILPQQLIEDRGMQNSPLISALSGQGLKWETYDWRPNETPDSFADEINRMVRCYLESNGQL